VKNKYDKWLVREMETWEKEGLADRGTIEKITAYYKAKEENEPNKLGAILGVLGSILIGLGIILILAKNWGYFPRGVKVTISLIPFLIGSFGGIFIIKKGVSGWIKEAAAIFTTIGILTAVVMSGQIYHILVDEWVLFFIITMLSLPLVYLYGSTLDLAAYLVLGSLCMFMTDLTDLWTKVILGMIIIGASIPFVKVRYNKDKFGFETGWCQVFLALAGFAFISSLAYNGVLLRELYFTYFILLVGLDALLYEDTLAFTMRPFAVVGNIGLYITLFVFTFSEFWRYVDTSNVNWQHMLIIVLFVGVVIGIIAKLITSKRDFTKRLFIYFIAIAMIIGFRLFGLLGNESSVILAVVLNIIFISLSIMTLREGIIYSSMSRMNIGLMLLAAITLARFFDSEFSFLVKGIVFIICGVIFLLANLYLAKKRKKEMTHV
jgi:uncharacterized membrane protein